MHGSDSQTARQACDLASPYIEPFNAIVLAPQFAEEYFPGDAYMFGNMGAFFVVQAVAASSC